MVVPESWTVIQLHETTEACRGLLWAAPGEATDVTIHFDPDSDGSEGSAWDVGGATRIRVPGEAHPWATR